MPETSRVINSPNIDVLLMPFSMGGDSRSLFNYLVPIVQDNELKKKREEGGSRPGQIGQVKGQHRAARWGIEG